MGISGFEPELFRLKAGCIKPDYTICPKARVKGFEPSLFLVSPWALTSRSLRSQEPWSRLGDTRNMVGLERFELSLERPKRPVFPSYTTNPLKCARRDLNPHTLGGNQVPYLIRTLTHMVGISGIAPDAPLCKRGMFASTPYAYYGTGAGNWTRFARVTV